jgi:hypothetical protein
MGSCSWNLSDILANPPLYGENIYTGDSSGHTIPIYRGLIFFFSEIIMGMAFLMDIRTYRESLFGHPKIRREDETI